MENFDVLYDSCSNNSTTKIRKLNHRTICDISNVGHPGGADKFKRSSIVQKYRSIYVKRYVYAKGVGRYRRRRKAFVIPVFHVSRRPDNPFNVKHVVENLRRKQMTSPQSSNIGDGSCYSNLESIRTANAKNWETIRYKYQLDYKEKLKMERENYLKEYTGIKKVALKQQRNEPMRPLYQTVDEPMTESPRKGVVPNEQLIRTESLRNPHVRLTEESKTMYVPSTEAHPQVSTFSGRSNISYESSRQHYHQNRQTEHGNNAGNNVCESVDLTKDCENNFAVQRSELKLIRIVRDERGNQMPLFNDSDAVTVPGSLERGMAKTSQSEDFDISIPFNESNILIKVMTPEGRTPSSPISQQPISLLQETLQYNAEPKQELSAPKRISFDEESKTINIRTEAGSGNQWLQYLQNILNRTCDPRDTNKKSTIDDFKATATTEPTTTNRRPMPIPTAGQQSNVTKVGGTGNSQATNYHDGPSSSGRIKQNRPTVSNPRVIKPKVIHPSPYFRSDAPRNPHYIEQVEDPNPITMPVRRHSPRPPMRRPSPGPQIPNQPNMPQHMEYVYRPPHPNYHHEFMVRSGRLPMDVPHSNLIGPPPPPIYSPYEHSYVHYHNEMEGIPQSYIDPYNQHNMHVPPLSRNIGFPPIRPSIPGIYRYLSPQHIHPVWIYPHMLER